MTIKLVIFDCDGTLIDSEPLCNRAFSEVLSEYGYTISPRECTRRFTGWNLADCIKAVEKDSGLQMPESFVDQFRSRMRDLFQAELQPIPGALSLLKAMRVPFCIASNGPREKMRESLRITGLEPLVKNRVFSAYDIQVWKPEPDLFLHTARHFACRPEECVVIEDSTNGLLAALKAKMQAIAFAPEGPRPDWPENIETHNTIGNLHHALAKRALAEFPAKQSHLHR